MFREPLYEISNKNLPRNALDENGPAKELSDRPANQRNDYLMWIGEAKHEETRKEQISQVLDKLRAGNVYMKMKWNSKRIAKKGD